MREIRHGRFCAAVCEYMPLLLACMNPWIYVRFCLHSTSILVCFGHYQLASSQVVLFEIIIATDMRNSFNLGYLFVKYFCT